MMWVVKGSQGSPRMLRLRGSSLLSNPSPPLFPSLAVGLKPRADALGVKDELRAAASSGTYVPTDVA